MAIRGRKKGIPNGITKGSDTCDYCEGIGFHHGKECFACNGTGSERTRRQLQKAYNSQNNIPINYNLTDKTK